MNIDQKMARLIELLELTKDSDTAMECRIDIAFSKIEALEERLSNLAEKVADLRARADMGNYYDG